MRKNTIILIAALFVANLAWATNGDPDKVEPKEKATSKYSLSNVFFDDIEEKLLFIDFQALEDPLAAIRIFKTGELMMEDRVKDLPANTIYEINLEVLREGTYDIELITDQNIKIVKQVIVK